MPSEQEHPLPKEYTAEMDVYKASTFGPENALILNCLQQIRDNMRLTLDSQLEKEILSRPIGTELEADVLTFTPSFFTCDVRDVRTCLKGDSFAGRTLRNLLFSDLKQNEEIPLSKITAGFLNFRKQLYNRSNGVFFDQEFTPKYFSATFGWEDALILNCLQYIKEKEDKAIGRIRLSTNLDLRYLGCFTPATGSVFEADEMTQRFYFTPYHVREFFYEPMAEVGALLKGLLFPGETSPTDPTDKEVAHSIMQLRRRIYNRLRMVAFMAVKHKRLGANASVNVLSDDLLHMILQFI
jgi:hypothetical protein